MALEGSAHCVGNIVGTVRWALHSGLNLGDGRWAVSASQAHLRFWADEMDERAV